MMRWETQRGRILFEFSLIYLAFSVVIILSSLWMSLVFIDKLIKPIRELAMAASRIGSGDFSVKVTPQMKKMKLVFLEIHLIL